MVSLVLLFIFGLQFVVAASGGLREQRYAGRETSTAWASDILVHGRSEAAASQILATFRSWRPEAGIGSTMSLEGIQHMEDTMVSMILASSSPALMGFVEQVLNITDNQMKVVILDQLNRTRVHAETDCNAVERCYTRLRQDLVEPNAIRADIPAHAADLRQCIYNLLVTSGAPVSGNSLKDVNWDVIAWFETVGNSDSSFMSDAGSQADPGGLSVLLREASQSAEGHYLDGDWPSSSAIDAIRKANPGMSECQALTHATCEKRKCECETLGRMNDIPGFDSSPDPDSSVCDQHGDKDVGEFLHDTYMYWKRMVDDYLEAECGCYHWTRWAAGNNTLCPVDSDSCPPPGPVPAPSPQPGEPCHPCDEPTPPSTTAATTTEAQTPTTQVTTTSQAPLDCHDQQDLLDREACRQTLSRIAECDDYNTCFISANSTWSRTWRDICGSGGELEALRNEYYAVLRIECIVHAVNRTPTERHAAIDECRLRDRSFYDLSMFNLKVCSQDWPVEKASADTDCSSVEDVISYVNMSGTAPYQDEWYRYIKYPKPCISTCCQTDIHSWQALTR